MPLFRRGKRFSSTNRLRADARMITHGIQTLYFPEKPLMSVKTRAKKEAKRTSFSTDDRLQSRNMLGVFNPITRKTKVMPFGNNASYGQEKRAYRSTLAHEKTHALGPSQNQLFAANAIGEYIKHIQENRLLLDNSAKNLEEELTSQSTSDFMTKATKSKWWVRRSPFIPMFVEDEYRYQGMHLGILAAYLEKKLQKPGAGALIIREITNGATLNSIIQRVTAGEMDAEITAWLKKNPRLDRILKNQFAIKSKVS